MGHDGGMRATRLTDRVTHHGEGPVWSPGWRGVRWVDMMAGAIGELDADGTVHRREVGDKVAAVVRPRTRGGWLVAREHDVAVTESVALDAPLRPLVSVLDDDAVRLNEGGCSPAGDFYIGSMGYGAPVGAGDLSRIRPDGTVSVVVPEVTISNGLDWSPDGSRAYYVDTRTDRIDVFDADPEHGLVNRRPFVEITDTPGHPDGLCVDSAGGVWVALFGGSAVRHYDADGTLDQVIEVDARQVTAVTTGGPDLTTLFITTSREGLTDDRDDPAAGSLFTAEAGTPGQPVRAFAG